MRVIPSSLAAFETLRLVRASAFFIKCNSASPSVVSPLISDSSSSNLCVSIPKMSELSIPPPFNKTALSIRCLSSLTLPCHE